MAKIIPFGKLFDKSKHTIIGQFQNLDVAKMRAKRVKDSSRVKIVEEGAGWFDVWVKKGKK